MNIKLSDHFTYKRLFSFIIPSIMMMIFISFYNVVDGLFISNYVGKTPFAAINLIYPVIMILGSIGFMLGAGGSALVSKTLGEGKRERANQIFTMIIIMTVILGVIFSIIAIIFTRSIAVMLGATGKMISDCVIYGRILLAFIPAFMLQNIFETFLITAQKPKIGLLSTVIAGITNIILDVLFIIVFKWELYGAALGTGIGYCVGTTISLLYIIKNKNCILKFCKTKLEFSPIIKVISNGSSEFLSNISASIVGIFFNLKLLELAGENGVASYGVLMYVDFMFKAIFIGCDIGTAPIIGYNYGAKNKIELNNIFKKSIKVILTMGIILASIAFLIKGVLSNIFVGYDKDLFEMTKHAFSIFSLSFILAGLNMFTSSLFTALNNGLASAILSLTRTLIFQIICVLILPILFGINGIWWSAVIAEVLAFITSIVFIICNRKKYGYI